MTPLKAIRAFCIECMCGQAREVSLCPLVSCSLWQYRMGHNPARQGVGGKGFTPKKPNSTSGNEAENEED